MYTVYSEVDPDSYKEKKDVNITVLKGVFLDAVKAENVRATGQIDADAATLYIPFDISAVDGVTGQSKRYVGAKEYWRAEDRKDLWTMSTGGNSFFVKGEVVAPGWDLQKIDTMYDDVYIVTSVDAKDYGSPKMRHWEVGGR